MTAAEHNRLLSIFFYVQGGLALLGAIIVMVIYGGLGTMMLSTSRRDDEQMMGGMFIVVGVIVGLIVLVFAIFDFVTATKLLRRRKIGRILGIVASCFSLLSFPLGTALGVYGLWFFLGDMGKQLYSEGGFDQGTYAAPPPNSWQ